jgi:predicted ATP-dependent serine protease
MPAGFGMGAADAFVNVVGGVRVNEPGADLAVALAVASAAKGVCLSGSSPSRPLACFGELGLTGELTKGRPCRAQAGRSAAFRARASALARVAPDAARDLAAALSPGNVDEVNAAVSKAAA